MELDYKIQTYAWGKKGKNSKVANLYANVNKSFKIDDKIPYAELWLGTHVNGPSSIKSLKTPLSDVFSKKPEYLGSKVRHRFGDQLPFLLKVLSVNQALSVQAHPSKQHAEELHKQQPDIYKDPNHKPEMAIALTPFEALCGFKPLPEIAFFLKNIPELKTVTGDVADKHTDETDLLKDAFKTIFVTPKTVIEEQLQKLIDRLKTLGAEDREKLQAELIERLHQQYPGDVGCFMVYFLNYLKLKPEEAIFLGPNLPHAYIYGDCIECMACSDNVVRAGLTPKLIDYETLCSMVIYEGDKPENSIFKPKIEDFSARIFKPPVPDFAVIQMKVAANKKTYEIKKRNSASILLIIEGRARTDKLNLIPGTALFLPADQQLKIVSISEDLLMYQALANV